MIKILHFADAHIDIAKYGRHDPQTGLPVRVTDFLKSLDTIVDAAINERVDLVIFAGDAYKDRNPAPTFQREWERRIARLSKAQIPTLLLVGNHDLSPALGRAHAVEEFATLRVPHVHVIDRPTFLKPAELNNMPLQVIAIPWISRAGLMAHLDIRTANPAQVYEEMGERLTELLHSWLEQTDPELPTVLTAHASIQGAKYGSERTVMLGSDLVLPGSLVRDPRLDYVALGHIHRPQNLNQNAHPPVIYSGSIERVDFGEIEDEKYFVVARVERGKTEVEWRQLTNIRPFVDRTVQLASDQDINKRLLETLPPPEELEGAIVRLIIEYPRELEAAIDEPTLREHTAAALEFHLIKRPLVEARVRLPEDRLAGSFTPLELLEIYWQAIHTEKEEIESLTRLAEEVIDEVHREPEQ